MDYEESRALFCSDGIVSDEQLLQALKVFVSHEKMNTGKELSKLCALRLIPYDRAQKILSFLKNQVKKSPEHPPIREEYNEEK